MQVDIRKIKSSRKQQQVMKLQSDAAWYEMKAALIRFYLAVRYYNPEQPRVPAGNGRESGQWLGDNTGVGGSSRVSDGRVQYAQVRTPRQFMSDAIEPLRINGREEELDQAEQIQYEAIMAARNWALGATRKIDPA